MSKILIVSDSHGSTELLEELKSRHASEVDAMIHCGDSELEKEDEALAGFTVVKGNCDFFGDFPEEALLEIDGYRIFVTHGHLHSVKSNLLSLSYRAEEAGASIICFGHSHLLGAEIIGGSLFINPGSIRLPRGRRERTYVILELKQGRAYLRVYDHDRGEITSLSQEFTLPAPR